MTNEERAREIIRAWQANPGMAGDPDLQTRIAQALDAKDSERRPSWQVTEVKCEGSHYFGCPCHEAKRDAEIERLKKDIGFWQKYQAETNEALACHPILKDPSLLAQITQLRAELKVTVEALEAAHGLIDQVNDHVGIVQYYGGYRAAKLVGEALAQARKLGGVG